MTYFGRTSEGSRSREMDAVVRERGEDPTFLGDDDDGNELYEFGDGSQVIITNAGVVSEDADGFTEARDLILSS